MRLMRGVVLAGAAVLSACMPNAYGAWQVAASCVALREVHTDTYVSVETTDSSQYDKLLRAKRPRVQGIGLEEKFILYRNPELDQKNAHGYGGKVRAVALFSKSTNRFVSAGSGGVPSGYEKGMLKAVNGTINSSETFLDPHFGDDRHSSLLYPYGTFAMDTPVVILTGGQASPKQLAERDGELSVPDSPNADGAKPGTFDFVLCDGAKWLKINGAPF